MWTKMITRRLEKKEKDRAPAKGIWCRAQKPTASKVLRPLPRRRGAGRSYALGAPVPEAPSSPGSLGPTVPSHSYSGFLPL